MSECSIASKIRRALDGKKWSVYELSKISGVSQSTISGILNDGKSPQYNTLEAISHAFGLEVVELLLIGEVPKEKEILTEKERGVLGAVRCDYETGAQRLIPYAMFLYPEYFKKEDLDKNK